MNIPLDKYLKLILPSVFAVVSLIILAVMNGDYLYALQEQSLFVKSHTFMVETLSRDGGVWTWLGAFFTQYLYYPWIGSLILIVLWIAAYVMAVYAFHLRRWYIILALMPQCILMYNILCIGYDMYYNKLQGIVFSPTLALVLFCAIASLKRLVLDRFGALFDKRIETLIVAAACTFICQPQFKSFGWQLPDHRLHTEVKMYRAIDECRWDDALKAYDKEDATTLMVAYKNIALMHTNRLTDMFKTGNCGTQPTVPEGHKLNISYIASSMLYYQFGQFNYAYRWAMENSVEKGLNYDELKMMTRCAIINQEFDLAAKYIAILKATTFHRQWAYEHERWLLSSNYLIQSEEFSCVSQLAPDEPNFLDLDYALPLKWIIDHFSDLTVWNTPRIEEVVLCTALWSKADYEFAYHINKVKQMRPNAPIAPLYQEAAIMFSQKEGMPPSLKSHPYDQDIIERYNGFIKDYNAVSKMNDGNMDIVASRLYPTYGDTYWWYYYFYTDFKIY